MSAAPGGRGAAERRATLADWQEAPGNRWSFCHVSELIPTARVSRGEAPVRPLEAGPPLALDAVRVEHRGRRLSVRAVLEEGYGDALAVVAGGRLVAEWYGPEMHPGRTHLLMSVSKSLTATLAGVLAGEGLLRPEDLVGDHVEALRATSFEGCSVRDLLDMRAGTSFGEDYDDPASDARRYEQVSSWRPRSDPGLPPDLYSYIPGLANAGAHGGRFDYRSILTDVLGWVLEEAAGARFADLLSERLFARIGAEHDAEVTVDEGGFALADGGICTTLRDLARLAALQLDGGVAGGHQVVPRAWIDETTARSDELVDAYRHGAGVAHPGVEMYHNNWWVHDTAGQVYSGLGIHGQLLHVDRRAGVAVVWFSTWPTALDRALHDLQLATAAALVRAAGEARGGPRPGSGGSGG